MKSHITELVGPKMSDELACIVAALGQADELPFVESPEARGAICVFADFLVAIRPSRRRGEPPTASQVLRRLEDLIGPRRRSSNSTAVDQAAFGKSGMSSEDVQILRQLHGRSREMNQTYRFGITKMIEMIWNGDEQIVYDRLQQFSKSIGVYTQSLAAVEETDFSLERVLS